MEEAIRNFNTQFEWKPVVANAQKLPKASTFVVGGMGGSHLSADLLSVYAPSLDIYVHRDYGIPAHVDGADALYIASSYSGNTEETLDFAIAALKKGYAVATVSVGGKLLEFAKANDLPHIVIPDTHIQPRCALGFAMVALAKLIGDETLLRELATLSEVLKPEELREAGKKLSESLRSAVPVVYASAGNTAVAYNWKIKLNETGKIPAFYNVLPELNHNEMTGFDITGSTEGLSRRFHFLFLSDTDDHPQTQKRMKVTRKLYEDRGLRTTEVALWGHSKLERIFTSLLIADWTALHISEVYGTEAEQVPMVEEFKRLIA